MKKIALRVDGRKMIFPEQELVYIVKKHFENQNTKISDTAQVPSEGKWFKVNPKAIDKDLFKDVREDSNQEATRLLIVEAFYLVEAFPNKYGKNFKTMMPKNTWSGKNTTELEILACELGDHMADWVEQSLEWAQRIANGEEWHAVCNDPDTANWHRLVKWKCDHRRNIGGSWFCTNKYPHIKNYPASHVGEVCYPKNVFLDTVPLVVAYDE